MTGQTRWVALALMLACSSSRMPGEIRRTARPAVAGPTHGRGGGAGMAGADVVTPHAALPPLTPYFASGPAAAAAARFRDGDYAAARTAWRRLLNGSAAAGQSTDERARIALLVAVCDAELGDWREAAAGFAAAAEALPLLAGYAHMGAARALISAGARDAAEEHLALAARDPRFAAEVALARADLQRHRGQWRAAAAAYREFLSTRPDSDLAVQARFRLAQVLERGGERSQSIALHRAIAIGDPLGAWGRMARDELAALGRRLPRKQRPGVEPVRAEEYIARGMAYYRANRNPQSAGDFAAALAARDLTPATRCVATFHLADSWFKERRRDRAAPLYDEAIAACKAAGNSDLAVRAAYQAGRAYCLLDQHEVALGRFEQAEAQRDHSYADDARKRRAEEYAELGQDAQVVDMLARLPELYPEGDMRAEAMWRLAFRAWRAGNDTAAAGWLHKQIAAAPVETRWYAEGQPQYWLGRIAARRGDRAQALHWYRECVRLYPLSYYSLLALNRLREQFPGEFEELSASLRRAGDEATPPVTVPAALVDSPGFQRAVEFTRLGLNRQAGLELVHLGLRTPPGKAQVADPQQVTRLWLLAFFYDALGRHDRAHWLARWHVLDYRRHWPQGAWRHKWRVAYPLAYHQLVAEAAAEHGYPAALQMAIMREESGFDPNLESYAGAVGLTQMIVPTAREYARGTGLRINRDTLRDPRLNVRIGSRFLASLWQRFGGHPGLVIPSYNAGAGATRRWLAARPDWQWDEWEEAILDDQARNYTKRVLASYLTYSFLHDGTIPVLPQTLPGPPRVAVSPTAPSR